jgi:hypothetical protein
MPLEEHSQLNIRLSLFMKPTRTYYGYCRGKYGSNLCCKSRRRR